MTEKGKKVRVHYTLKVEGEILDSTLENEPFEFQFGSDEVVPGFQENIRGLQGGDKKTFTLQPKEAFGERDPNALISVKRENLPEGEVKVGMVFATQSESGESMRGIVTGMEGEHVLLDFNHPLAGKVLEFEVEIIEVK